MKGENAVGTISKWPKRLTAVPLRAALMKSGVDVFEADTRRWTRRVAYYKNSLNLKLGTPSIRNIMDMNAFFGGFAAALLSDPVWVMNVVPSRKPLTLGIIYDRGLIGVYHDWWVLSLKFKKIKYIVWVYCLHNHLSPLKVCVFVSNVETRKELQSSGTYSFSPYLKWYSSHKRENLDPFLLKEEIVNLLS